MLQVRLLGQFEVRLNGAVVDIPSRPAQSLLAYLLLNAGTPHRREKLAGLLWPEANEANARSNLRHAVWRLRRSLEPGEHSDATYLQADNFTVAFSAESDFWLDTAVLEQGAEADDSVEGVIEAVSVYRGELLPGFYADWANLERERLHNVFERQIQQLLDRLVADGQWTDILTWAERWISLGQAPERAYRALMLAHAELGDQASVALDYQRCRDALQRELAVEPSEQTRALYERLCRAGAGSPVTSASALSAPAPPPAPLPEPFVAGAAQPPPRTAEPAGAFPIHNLPAPSTRFVGRERELADVQARLRNPACRLLTLTGPGGIGKTRLALEAALAFGRDPASPFPDGACFAPLAAVSASEFVVSAIAEALRFTFYGGDDPRLQVINYLRERRLLLLLDNFEHLLDGASLIAELLRSAPGVKLMVTSQERLSLQGEWLLEVDGMPFPVGTVAAGLEPTDYSAVQLFVECARRVDAGFDLTPEDLPAVLRICRLVAGMPLGIELAAAWVRTISAAEIAREIERGLGVLTTTLRDVPERHRSLQAVCDHSWQRLSERERDVYRQLSIFSGGFQREAAENLAGATLADLSALVDKSLLRRSSDGRYGMHSLLRKYAHQKLRDGGDLPEVRARHLDYFHRLTREAEPGLRSAAQLDWIARLEVEHDNLRSAMKWAVESSRPELGQEIAGSLARFWYLRGYWQEGRDWLGQMLARGFQGEALVSASECIRAARAKALLGAAWLADENGDEGPLYEESLALCRSVGDRWGAALSLRGVGVRHTNDGELASASELLGQSLAEFEALGDPWGVALVQYNLGWNDFGTDEFTRSNERWEHALGSFRSSGDRWGQAVALGALSYMARLRDEYAQATQLSEQGLVLFRELGDKAGMAVSLVRLAQLAFRRGNYPQAVHLINESLALVQDLGDKRSIVNGQSLLGLICAYQGRYAEARELLAGSQALGAEVWGRDATPYILNYQALTAYLSGRVGEAGPLWEQALEQHRAQEDKLGTAASLHGLGLLAARTGDLARAVELLDYSLNLYRETRDRRYIAIAANSLGRVFQHQGDHERAWPLLKESLQLRKDMGDRQGFAESLETVAGLMLETEGQAAALRAARLLGAAHGLRQAIGAPVPAVEQPDHDQLLASVRQLAAPPVGPNGFQAAWEAGLALASSAPEKLLEQALAPAEPPP
jgi:predicted ATPase/DNA-binding SARP family transcriptional activator